LPSAVRKELDQTRKDRTKRLLLRAATRVFTKNGYHNTLVSDIVAEAGVGQGTFYRHFKDKRNIFDTLAEGFLSELFEEFSDMSANPPTNVAEYRAASLSAISRAARIVERNQDLCLVFMREAPTVDDEASKTISGVYERLAQLAGSYLRHAIEKGFARPCNVEMVSRAIVGMGIRTVEVWLNNQYGGMSTGEIVKELVDFAFLGLGPNNTNGNTS